MVKLIPAYIDDKNIVSDFVYSDLYDNSAFAVSDKDDAVGFVNNIPIVASYKKETMKLDFPKTLRVAMKANLIAAILKRLTGGDEPVKDEYICDVIYFRKCATNKGEKKMDIAMRVFETYVEVSYYWQIKD